MKGKAVSLGIPCLAVVGGGVGLALHRALRSGGSVAPLSVLALILSLLFLLTAISLKKQSAFSAVFRRCPADLLLTALGSLALIVGCAQSFPGGTIFGKGLSLLGIIGAVGLTVAAKLRFSGKTPQPFFCIPAVLFYAVKLFCDFRHWMVDPAIIDYAFSLFALICFMLTAYQTAAFCYDRGSRRQLAFFALCGTLFGLTAMDGAILSDLLIYGGSALCMLACSLQACSNGAQTS